MADSRINFEQMVRDFEDTTLANSTRIRRRSDQIATLLLSFLGPGSEPEIPDTPTNLQASGGEGVVALTWSPVAAAATYLIHRVSLDATGSPVDVLTTATNSYLDTGLDPGTYSYAVQAANLIGELSDLTDPETAVVTAPATIKAPSPPGSFAVAAARPTEVDLTWAALASGTEAVRIDRRRQGVPEWTTIVESLDATAYTDTGLEELRDYEYRAFGINVEGTLSPATATITASTTSSDTIAPPVPTGLTATGGNGVIDVSWDASPAADISFYRVQQATASGGPYTAVATSSKPQLAFPSPNGTQKFIQVNAVDRLGNESAYSAFATATPEAPAQPDITPPIRLFGVNVEGTSTPGELRVSWDQPSLSFEQNLDIATFTIYRADPPASSASGPYGVTQSVATNVFEYTFGGLAQNQTYYFYVTATDTSGNESEPSVVVQAVVPGEGTVDPGGGGTGQGPGTETPADTEGILAVPTDGQTVHRYADNTLEQNKNLFADKMVTRRRPTRASVYNSPGSRRPDDPELIDLIDRTVVGPPNFHSVYGVTRRQPVVLPALTRVPVISEVDFTQNQTAQRCYRKWIQRRYDMAGSVIHNSDYGFDSFDHNTTQVSFVPPQFYTDWQGVERERLNCVADLETNQFYGAISEHGHYDAIYGSIFCVGNTYRRMGGRGMYFSHRPFTFQQYPPDNPAFSRSSLAYIDNCHTIDCDADPGRGAFNLTFFDYGSPTFPSKIIVRNSSFVGGFPFYRRQSQREPLSRTDLRGANQWYRSNGGITVSQFQFCESPDPPNAGNTSTGQGVDNPGFDMATMNHICDQAVFSNCLFHFVQPEKPLLQVECVDEVIIENCLFIAEDGAGIVRISENRKRAAGATYNARDTKACQTIRVRNCMTRGNVKGFIRPDGAIGVNDRVEIDLNTVGIERVYNSEGVLQSETAFDDTTQSFDPVPVINAMDPFNGMNLGGFSLPWPLAGVTV